MHTSVYSRFLLWLDLRTHTSMHTPASTAVVLLDLDSSFVFECPPPRPLRLTRRFTAPTLTTALVL